MGAFIKTPASASSDAHSWLLQSFVVRYSVLHITNHKRLRHSSIGKGKNKTKCSYESRLRCCHVRREKKSCASCISLVHPATISSRWSEGSRKDHNYIQCTVIWITYKTWKVFCLLNTRLFLQFHIDQQIADTPMRILALVFLSTSFNQFPNIFETLVGGGIL